MPIYLINDVTSSIHTKTIAVCETEDDVLNKLKDVKFLKRFKGEIKIVKVIL